MHGEGAYSDSISCQHEVGEHYCNVLRPLTGNAVSGLLIFFAVRICVASSKSLDCCY